MIFFRFLRDVCGSYLYFVMFVAVTFLYVSGSFYISHVLEGLRDQKNGIISAERMVNVSSNILNDYQNITNDVSKLTAFIQSDDKVAVEEIKKFVHDELLHSDTFSYIKKDDSFVLGYIVVPEDNYSVLISDNVNSLSGELTFSDSSSKYYINLTKNNPDDVVVQGPVISAKSHALIIFCRQAVYVGKEYWGYIGVLVDFYKLLESIKLTAEDDMFVYAIRASIYKGSHDFVWGDSTLFKRKGAGVIQKSIFFGKQRWDMALRVKDRALSSNFYIKFIAVMSGLWLITLMMGYYLVSFVYTSRRNNDKDRLTDTMYHENFFKIVKRQLKNQYEHGFVVVELTLFKQINSCYDYSVGDAMLKEATKNIRSFLSYTDMVCRIGSEFIIFIPKIKSTIDVERVQADLSEVLNTDIKYGNFSINLGAVVGSCNTISHGRDFHNLMHIVNEEMFEQKKRRGAFSQVTDCKSTRVNPKQG